MSKKQDDLIRIEDAIKVLCRKTCHYGVFCQDSYCVEMWDEFKDVERVDAVPAGAYKQVRWERDVAVQQLDTLGYEPGEKVVPVRHGRWIYHPDWQADGECGYECSECGMGSEVDYPYCMRCGARMDGKDGDRHE